ncbi:MAG: hypothetical protein DELT_03336 [Desulfovibrio sp.]
MFGRPKLLDHAVIHHGNRVAHGEGLFLVVRYINKGDAKGFLHPLQFELHFLAEFEVERAEGFVEQEHLRLVHEGAGNGDALLLSAGELGDIAVSIAGKAHKPEHIVHLFLDRRFIHLFDFKAERDVVKHIEMRKQRVFLEHRIDPPFIGRQALDAFAKQVYVAARRFFKARDDAQKRCFPAA